MDYYQRLLAPIQDEMKAHGIASIVILHEGDPIGQQSSVSLTERGETFLLRGMFDHVYHHRG